MRRSRLLAVATLAWLAVIALITLTPAPYPFGEPSDLIRGIIAFLGSTRLTRWFDFTVAEFTANVLLFVPLGALVAALIGLGVSAVSETAQLLWLPTGVADGQNLVSNGSGSLLGAQLTVLLIRYPHRPRKDRTAHAH